MGADMFEDMSTGKDADAAFSAAVDRATWEHGHGGYTGTIAEKPGYRMVTYHPMGVGEARKLCTMYHEAMYLSQEGSWWSEEEKKENRKKLAAMPKAVREARWNPYDDKWGDAGCIEIKPETVGTDQKVFLFFGYASS